MLGEEQLTAQARSGVVAPPPGTEAGAATLMLAALTVCFLGGTVNPAIDEQHAAGLI